jgi:hypothetical protein
MDKPRRESASMVASGNAPKSAARSSNDARVSRAKGARLLQTYVTKGWRANWRGGGIRAEMHCAARIFGVSGELNKSPR